VLLVSVSLASATNCAVTGTWQITEERSDLARPSAGNHASSGAARDLGDARTLDVACISRFAAYSASLVDAVQRCSLRAGNAGEAR
jgi:hypothetical protein